MDEQERERNNRSKDWQRVDARFLGQILAAQNILFVLPDEAKIAEFFSQALTGIPGVTSCIVCLGNVPVTGKDSLEVCSKCSTLQKKEEATSSLPCNFLCGYAEKPDMHVITIATNEYTFGFFVFKIESVDAFEPYSPFLQNLANFVALSLENRTQRLLLEKTHIELENRVMERTEELRQMNERFSLAANASHFGIWDWDIQKNELVWDNVMYTLYGIKKGDFTGAYEAWLKGVHPDDRARSNEMVNLAQRGEQEYDTEFRVVWPDGSIHYLKAYGQIVRDVDGTPLRMTGINFDITGRKHAGDQILKLNRIYAVLSNINKAIVRIHESKELFDETCRIAVEYGKFRMVWIGMVNSQTNKVDVVASSGVSGDYLEKVTIDLKDDLQSSGPTGIAIKTGNSKISNNIENDKSMIPWHEDALRYDYKSCASFPLMVFNKVIGSFTIYSNEIGFFEEDDINLLDEMAKDISFALEFIKSENERKRSEEALHLSEERYRRIAENAQDVIYRMSLPDGKYEYVSPAALSVFGYSPEDFYSTPMLVKQAIHPDWLKYFEEQWTNLMKGKMPPTYEYQIIHKSGEIRWLNQRNILVQDSLGNPVAIEGIITDISQRRQLELALLSSETELRALIAAMTDVILVVNSEGRYLKIAETSPSLLYKPPNELLGKTLHEIFPKVQADMFLNNISYALKTYKPVNFEYCLPIGNNNIWFNATISPMSDDRILLVARDISQRKKAEEALRESEQKFRSFIEESSEGITLLDEQGVIIEWNCAREKMTGLPASQVIGQKLWDVLHQMLPPELQTPERLEHNKQLMLSALQTGKSPLFDNVFESEVVRKNGEHHFIQQTIFPIKADKGYRMGSLTHDITDRKQAEEEIRKLNQELEKRVIERTTQLEAANKELEAFAYSVSHDLRTPLRGIDGFSQALLEEYDDKLDTQGKNYLHRVRFAAQRMAQLIDDLLSLSRISRRVMSIQQVNLSEMFSEIADDLRTSQPERKIRFIIQKEVTAQADGRLMRIVLENLIGNAWKFTSKHQQACIEFGMKQQKGMPVYFISDDGAGFNMNYAQKLFGAFQRLHTVNEFQGTGIGLATVQRIIHRHGGEIWAESEVEKGTTFYFTIP